MNINKIISVVAAGTAGLLLLATGASAATNPEGCSKAVDAEGLKTQAAVLKAFSSCYDAWRKDTLAQEKLVEVYPRRGIVVSPVDVGDLASLSEVRITLESFAAHQAAERANAGDREAARSLLAELPGVAAADDERALIELDRRIHRHVYRCAHNPYLESTLSEYYTLTLRIWFLALDRVARLDDAVTEHGEILQAIIDGDAGNAGDVMRRHIEAFERAIRAVL